MLPSLSAALAEIAMSVPDVKLVPDTGAVRTAVGATLAGRLAACAANRARRASAMPGMTSCLDRMRTSLLPQRKCLADRRPVRGDAGAAGVRAVAVTLGRSPQARAAGKASRGSEERARSVCAHGGRGWAR